jgi:tRNA C32,U32 (ribose-2'-O)-methylase TrmJ
MKTEHAQNSIESLKVMGHHQKAEVFQEILDEANLYKKEVERLLNIFKKLDKYYKPHSNENPWGMMDSPVSLQKNTRDAINAALNLKDEE